MEQIAINDGLIRIRESKENKMDVITRNSCRMF